MHTPDVNLMYPVLKALHHKFRCRYSQWIIEDPENHDYKVVASLLPEGQRGYDVAHRTGVIGQVFRLEKPIVVANTKSHPLYDSFDDMITWELALPLFADGKLAAVINLEGTGRLDLETPPIGAMASIVHANTPYRLPAAEGRVASDLIRTRKIIVRAPRKEEQSENLVALARTVATDGHSTLLVGRFRDLAPRRSPELDEAEELNLEASYCCFGVASRLDLLATGKFTERDILKNRMSWWQIANGRYSFVFVHVPSLGESRNAKGRLD